MAKDNGICQNKYDKTTYNINAFDMQYMYFLENILNPFSG